MVGERRVACAQEEPLSAAGVPVPTGPFSALVIGASFGGPSSVEAIVRALPRTYPLPVAICQHIASGFTGQWAERLDDVSALKVAEARSRAVFEPGHVVVAPTGRHLRFGRGALGPFVRLDLDFADSLHVPSIDFMMSSAAEVFGTRTLAVLLSGLGSDGACGMLAVRRAGGYTIAESAETAASHSMPGSAVALGAVVQELPIERVIDRVVTLGMRR